MVRGLAVEKSVIVIMVRNKRERARDIVVILLILDEISKSK